MRFNNAIIGTVLLFFASAVLWHVRSFPSLPLNRFGPATFPTALSLILVAASIILIVNGVRNWKFEPALDLDNWTRIPVRWRRMFLIPFVVVLYILVSNPLGFIPTTFGLLFLMLFDYSNGRIWLSVSVAAAFTAVTYSVFVYILFVPLPPGVLSDIIR